MPLAMTKQIYCSDSNVYIKCQDKVLYLNKLHKMVKNNGCCNSKSAQISVPSGLNIKAWRQVLQEYDITNPSRLFIFLKLK